MQYIAINDGVDTLRSENEMMVFKNVFNDWYARDTSKKIRAVFNAKGKSGTADTARFVEIVHKYSEVKELTPTIMHEFVEKIVVHAPDKSGGHHTQKIDIYWRFNVAVSTATANRLDYRPKRRKAV